MEEIITAQEAEKELGISRRTIQRWEEWNWFKKGLVKSEDGTRLYRRSHLQWSCRMVSKWKKLRQEEREHLKKLPIIQKKIERFIQTQPLERTYEIEPVDFRVLQAAYVEMDEWEKVRRQHHANYNEFMILVNNNMDEIVDMAHAVDDSNDKKI